jgi:Terminase large subunit, T4likevirus-type, N-terminal
MKWLRNATDKQNLLVTGNRWGKSFVSAIRALHHAVFQIRDTRYDKRGHYRVVTASITQDQAGIIWGTALKLARSSAEIEPLIKEIARTPFPRIVFGNGSEITSRSTQNRGEYLLGNDYDYFIFDEVAFESHADYVVNEVILMRLADREGKLDFVSTPNGKNWLYQKARELQTSDSSGYLQFGDSRENIHISAEYLNRRLEFFSADRVAQNIMGHFVDSGREIVSSEMVDFALSLPKSGPDVSMLKKDCRYLSGWDLARKRTATVGVTVAVDSTGTATVVAVERFRRMDWNYVFGQIRSRQTSYPGVLVLDATGLGDVVTEELQDLAPVPFIFSEKSKAALLTNLEMFHALKKIHYSRWEIKEQQGKIWALEDELRAATWDDNGRCDGVMALALALWPLRRQTLAPITQPRISAV